MIECREATDPEAPFRGDGRAYGAPRVAGPHPRQGFPHSQSGRAAAARDGHCQAVGPGRRLVGVHGPGIAGYGCDNADRRRIRLHHCRRGLGRLRAGQPAVGRSGKRVLLLEAGGRDNWIWFHIPVGYLFAIGNPRSDWMFKTEPEPGLNGRSLTYPRGKVIGGSSAINAMIYMRGQAADYDHWRQLGLDRLGLGRRAAVLQAARESFPRRERASRDRRRMAHRGAARALGSARRVPRGGRAGRHQAHPRFQHRRQRRLVRLPRQPEARPALVGGARLPQAGAQPRKPAARDRLPGRARRVRRQARRRRALAAGRRARNRRAAAAR